MSLSLCLLSVDAWLEHAAPPIRRLAPAALRGSSVPESEVSQSLWEIRYMVSQKEKRLTSDYQNNDSSNSLRTVRSVGRFST